jgi:hypothetical protein
LTSYDEEHLVTYLRLLDADAKGADWRVMGQVVLHLVAPPTCSMRVSKPPIARGRSVNWRKSPCPLETVIIAPDG